VGASAGTGKTKVLTDRVLRLLLEGIRPERILCLTFTTAAAAEMANRILAVLSRWATEPDEAVERDLAELTGGRPPGGTLGTARRLFARVLDAPGGLRMQTIHAFCQSLLRRFPLEAGIAPHFTLMDERSAADLVMEVREGLLATGRPEVAEAMSLTATLVNEEGFGELMGEVMRERGRLERILADHGGGRALLAAVWRTVGLAEGTGEAAIIQAAVAPGALDEAGLTHAARILVDHAGQTGIQRGEAMATFLEAPPADRRELLDDWRKCFLRGDGEPLKAIADGKALAADPAIAGVLAAEAARLVAVDGRRRAARTAEATSALLIVATAILEGYAVEKERRGLLDYDDLVLLAARLLERPGVAPWVLFKLDGGIDHILIDEAQDTNPDQWRVVAALTQEYFAGEGAASGRRTVFAVGDEKQSIFSFQRADPAAFSAMRGRLGERARAAGQPWEEVDLEVSFRSVGVVLAAVDAVFARPQARAGLSSRPDQPIRHEAFRRGEGGLVELWPIIAPDPAAEDEPWTAPRPGAVRRRPEARLADHIATTIRGWLDGREMLEARGRPMEAGDILILVRTRNAFYAELVRSLKARNVPIAGVDRMILTKQLAVEDVLALLRFLLLPEDDLTLAAILKSPFIGMTDEDLIALLPGRRGSLWRALREVSSDPRTAAVVAWLTGLLAGADARAPFEQIAAILAAPCPADPEGSGRRAILKRLGAEAEDPLDELAAAALAFEATNVPSLQRFVHWIQAGEAEVKRELDRAGAEVRIMTVHGAKGLQAPVVILPDTVSRPGRLARIRWPDREAGVPLWSPVKADEDAATAAARAAAEMRREEEQRRLLYVAMTRAEDRLYIAGWRGDQAAPAGCWHDLCRPAVAALPGAVEVPFAPGGTAIRVHVPQTAPAPAPAGAPGASTREALPAWTTAPPRPELRAAPLRPSGDAETPALSPLGDEDQRRFQRGRLVHALLESLPDIPPGRRAEAARRWLARPAHGLDAARQEEIAAECLAVLEHPAFAAVFGPGSRAEVPVVGMAEGRSGPVPVSGQIDRLVVGEGEVLVVDFKTNRPAPLAEADVAPGYLAQMAAYRAVLRGIWPGRPVRCALLWTDGPRLMPLGEGLLDRHAP
jgi:ATP-dependent helicase/nuclease subunit A